MSYSVFGGYCSKNVFTASLYARSTLGHNNCVKFYKQSLF